MFRLYKRRLLLFLSLLLPLPAGGAPDIATKSAVVAAGPDAVAPPFPVPITEPSPGEATPKHELLTGTWSGGGCTYRIDPGGMLWIQRIGAPSDTLRGRYSWFRMGKHDCISMQREGGDILSLQVLLIGEVTESRAVIALGTPFMRAEKGKGIPGVWQHLDRLSRMEWKFGAETAEYRRTIYSPRPGGEQRVESRTGVYREASGKYEEGSFQLSFEDGSRAVILPIVYRNLMYVFDLSPAKSLFSRVREPVTDAGRVTSGTREGKEQRGGGTEEQREKD